MKLTFTCDACKRTMEGFGSPLTQQEMEGPLKDGRMQPITVNFATMRESFWLCFDCHTKMANVTTSWIKNGLVMVEKEIKEE